MAFAIEGLGTTISFQGVGSASGVGSAGLCMVSLSAPMIDGQEALDTTCLTNSNYITGLPQQLKATPDISFTAKFNPSDLTNLLALINVNQEIIFNFSYQGTDLGSISVFGWLSNYNVSEGAVGAAWEMTGVIKVGNTDAAGDEQGPVYTASV